MTHGLNFTGRSETGKARLTTRRAAFPASGNVNDHFSVGPRRSPLRVLYRFYEHRLLGEVQNQPLPRHIGIILDGNRRYGERHGILDPHEIYAMGARKLDAVLDWCGELAIPAVTLWVCSTDNLERPVDQVAGILAAIEAKLWALAHDPQIHCRRVQVQAIGKLELLPGSVITAIRAARQSTAKYDGMILTIAVAYGGRQEIVDSVRALLVELIQRKVTLPDAIKEVTTTAIGRHLYMAGEPDPDLIIRTSGEIRLSGFLLWQSAYSEFYFCDVPWPALRKIDFLRAVRDYQRRKRRFGK
ncbi:undecaprenyl diphosphate synthase [Hyphomicrobium denitrificans 1NES1]|uniref:Isoprenyl transferase n=1 Tax=Hyphomicrobium denitrificans 1NES1 TaxID=670307 RepID=N0BHV6_9HYPH|nr:undecaprenyl diphosphate synthase [Hyphomicrobium denitrificans 1NES1]